MSSTQSDSFNPSGAAGQTGLQLDHHPLDPLSTQEIAAVSLIVRSHFAACTSVKAIKFVSSLLIPPVKAAVLYALGLPLPRGAKLDSRSALKLLNRRTEVQLIDVVTGDTYEVNVAIANDLPLPGRDGKYAPSTADALGKVKSINKLDVGIQPGLTPEEVLRNDPRIVAIARAVGIEPENLWADGWSLGYDDRFDKSLRVQQCLVYARKSEHENLYAHPMDFYPVIDCNAGKVIAIDFPGHRDPVTGKLSTPNGTTKPGPITMDADEALAYSGRKRIPPPMESFDYLPELMALDPKMPPLRTDLKPLHMHIGFHPRDGLVLSTISYNDRGNVRPILYRMSVAEMVVPYASTEHPHPRKFAFDVGEYGMGTLSNSLKLGCDCLGTIHYLDGHYVGLDGSPAAVENAICIHEEDAGIAWKHTDYRPGGKVRSARGRKLVIQMICTIANYEYIFAYMFHTDGSIQLETKLSGILNLYVKDKDEPNPYGVEVAPQVNAHYHQHLFALKIDPMVDGCENTVIQTDCEPTSAPTGSDRNYLGNGFVTVKTPINVSGGYDWDWSRHRTWAIYNTNKQHYSAGLPVGYKIHTRDWEPLALQKDSMVAQRAEFTKHALWVTKFNEEQLWPAGKYVPQQRGTAPDSIGHWANEKNKVDDEEITVHVIYGITHIPHAEQFPVMPVEHLNVWLKPSNFFDFNPAKDLPALNDPYSVNAFGSSTSKPQFDVKANAAAPASSSASSSTSTTNGDCCKSKKSVSVPQPRHGISISTWSASLGSASNAHPQNCACCASDSSSRL
ncbi:hypothetical protein NDA18_005054 [Ustilago nuda]|nr:hypothetical protein NDA18_005054 [Ustilago nuda]